MNLLQKIAALPDALTGRLLVDPERNGEYRFLRRFLQPGMLIVDVGANTGYYSEQMLRICPQLRIHSFEPVSATFQRLSQTLATHIDAGRVVANKTALGSSQGQADIFVYADDAGSNSLYFHETHAAQSRCLRQEQIKIDTLDNYLTKVENPIVDFLKIDVEGHETDVILGAATSIRSGRVHCIQFEYNNYWRRSNRTLREMIHLLCELNRFSVFRLTPWGRLRIRHHEAVGEDYKQSNYVAFLDLSQTRTKMVEKPYE